MTGLVVVVNGVEMTDFVVVVNVVKVTSLIVGVNVVKVKIFLAVVVKEVKKVGFGASGQCR